MPNTAKARIEEAIRLLSIEAWSAEGKELPFTYTLAEDLYRIQSALGGGPFALIGDAIKDATVELRLALEALNHE